MGDSLKQRLTKTERLADLLRQAATALSDLYERPTSTVPFRCRPSLEETHCQPRRPLPISRASISLIGTFSSGHRKQRHRPRISARAGAPSVIGTVTGDASLSAMRTTLGDEDDGGSGIDGEEEVVGDEDDAGAEERARDGVRGREWKAMEPAGALGVAVSLDEEVPLCSGDELDQTVWSAIDAFVVLHCH